jgi:hypothetical protein
MGNGIGRHDSSWVLRWWLGTVTTIGGRGRARNYP